jgi:hypothetical protein
MEDSGLQRAVDGELSLLTPEVRQSRQQLELLLDADFVEIGASGRLWEREELISDLTSTSAPVVQVEGMDARRVAGRIVVVTYVTVSATRRVVRSSWWRESNDVWKCFFHQGTVA